MLDLGASIAVYWLQLMLSSRAVESGGQVLVGMLMGSGLVDFAHAFCLSLSAPGFRPSPAFASI